MLRGTARTAWVRAQEAYVDHMLDRDDDRSVSFGLPPQPEGALEEGVTSWFESSLAMHHLCEPRGILFLHVLQPTLHDPGSKPITAEVRAKGIGDRGLNPNVVEGYAMMRARLPELIDHGVHC